MLEINFLEMTTSLKRNDTQSLIQVLPMSMGSSLESPQTLWEGSCGNGLKDTFFFFKTWETEKLLSALVCCIIFQHMGTEPGPTVIYLNSSPFGVYSTFPG